jgi:hypothetical protein
MTTAYRTAWEKAHTAYLEMHLHRMRLLVQRRIQWLRSHHWHADPAEAPEVDPDARADRLAAVESPAEPGLDRTGDTDEDEPVRLANAIAAHESRLAEYEAELSELGAPDGVTALCNAAGLDDMEREAVVAALCAELDPAVADLFAYLHDDPHRRHATPGLVAALHRRSVSDAWPLLDPASQAIRFRIFRAEAAGSGAPLRLDRRMVNFLRGHNHIDDALTGLVSMLPDTRTPARSGEQIDRLATWLAGPDRAGGPVTVNLVGPSAETRRAFAARLIRSLGLHPLRLHLDRLVNRPERVDLIRLVEREALLLPAGVYLEYLDAAGGPDGDPGTASAARELVEDLGGLVVIGSVQRWDGNRAVVVHPVPALGPADRAELWEAALGGPLDGLDGVVEQFAVGPESIMRAAAEAEAARQIRPDGAVGTDSGDLTADDVWSACRRFVGRELGELATRVEPAAGWDDIVLPAGQYALLREISAQVRNRAQVYERWGFGAALTRGRGISALFTGPPGTGKTMAAEIIATDLELDLYRIDLASVVSKYIGETEKNLRRVFDAAEQGGAILFFDEADALFGKRTEVKDSHDRNANIEINYLLQRMEQYAGLAILATNRKSDLDPAFLRRIRFVVAFPFPNPADRRRIWAKAFPNGVPRGRLDLDALAKLDLAGGNIRNIAVNAAFLAAAAGQPVEMVHMMQAARHEYRKTDKIPSRGEFGDYYEMIKS